MEIFTHGMNISLEKNLNLFIYLFIFSVIYHRHSLMVDCESLIRKMLVLDPNRRVTIEQIKRHRWMMAEALETPNINNMMKTNANYEPNDQILRIMQNLGIDAQRTRESLKVNI